MMMPPVSSQERQQIQRKAEDRAVSSLITKLLREARDLRSETGANREYDRALVELTCRALSLSTEGDLRVLVEFALGIRS